MKTLIPFYMLALSPLLPAQRAFTNSDGKKLEADIVSATGTETTLKRKSDGKDFTIPLSSLSKEDQEFISAWRAYQLVNTRQERTFEGTTLDEQKKTMTIPKGEYLSSEGALTLYPGDTVNLEFTDGKPRVVKDITKPDSTVTFKMTQEEGMTMLHRTTKVQQTVAMDCIHQTIESEQPSRTNLRPTEKGMAAFDSWPGTVWMVKLSNFEVTDRPAQEVYQERVAK